MASVAFAETDSRALKVIRDIQRGEPNANAIQDLYVIDDADIDGDINVDGGAVIDGNAVVSGIVSGKVAGAGVQYAVGSATTVTNGQAITLVAGKINVLRPSGGAALSTNTCTIASFAAADVGKMTWVVNASLVTNYLYIAQSGNWYGPAVSLNVGESMCLFATATNVLYAPDR
jgi:hypothetical protein